MSDETTKDMVVELNGEEIGTQVSEATMDLSGNMADCTALNDEFVDNRLASKNATANVTMLCKNGYEFEGDLGDVVEVSVDGQAADVILANIQTGGGKDQPRTVRLTLVSKLEV